MEAYGRERWNKEKLAARFRQGIEWGAKNQVPLYCGEFGVFPARSKPEHRANWFRDFGEVLAENHIGWAVWGWDEGFGLVARSSTENPWWTPWSQSRWGSRRNKDRLDQIASGGFPCRISRSLRWSVARPMPSTLAASVRFPRVNSRTR